MGCFCPIVGSAAEASMAEFKPLADPRRLFRHEFSTAGLGTVPLSDHGLGSLISFPTKS